VKAAREKWFEQFLDVTLDRFIFIDEFGASTHMQRLYGRAPRGQRVVSRVPHGHWKILSTIAAMTSVGMVAAATFEGATDTELFVTFVREALVPVLKEGQVVVMDNLSPHKSPRVRELIEAAGAKLVLLPPYSPDFNPIEMAISKIKSVLRKLAKRAVPELFAAIDEALRSITDTDATNFIHHSGYATKRCNLL
jgi:transposase